MNVNVNVKEGKNRLQVEDCWEGQSQNTGNKYWGLKCSVLPDPKAAQRNNTQREMFCVYFLKKFEWSLQNLQNIVMACGADKPWNMNGKRFIADVGLKNGFYSLKHPQPYVEEPEETQQSSEESNDINSRSEWPW